MKNANFNIGDTVKLVRTVNFNGSNNVYNNGIPVWAIPFGTECTIIDIFGINKDCLVLKTGNGSKNFLTCEVELVESAAEPIFRIGAKVKTVAAMGRAICGSGYHRFYKYGMSNTEALPIGMIGIIVGATVVRGSNCIAYLVNFGLGYSGQSRFMDSELALTTESKPHPFKFGDTVEIYRSNRKQWGIVTIAKPYCGKVLAIYGDNLKIALSTGINACEIFHCTEVRPLSESVSNSNPNMVFTKQMLADTISKIQNAPLKPDVNIYYVADDSWQRAFAEDEQWGEVDFAELELKYLANQLPKKEPEPMNAPETELEKNACEEAKEEVIIELSRTKKAEYAAQIKNYLALVTHVKQQGECLAEYVKQQKEAIAEKQKAADAWEKLLKITPAQKKQMFK